MIRRIIPVLMILLLLCACGAPAAPAPASEAGAPPAGPSCTITIRCDTLLDHMDELSMGVAALVPEDGCLLEETAVALEEGDTVFTVLQKATEQADLHLEFSTSPMYDSKYIEGLCNLYEMDAGPLSGWTYSVNGVFPGYGTSQYTVSDGDVIRLLYTCDLGADVGNDRGALQ